MADDPIYSIYTSETVFSPLKKGRKNGEYPQLLDAHSPETE